MFFYMFRHQPAGSNPCESPQEPAPALSEQVASPGAQALEGNLQELGAQTGAQAVQCRERLRSYTGLFSQVNKKVLSIPALLFYLSRFR